MPPERLRRAGLVLLPALLLAAAAWSLRRELHGFHLADVEPELAAVPAAALWLAAAVTAADYLLLGGYDLLALRYAGRTLAPGRVLFTSFIAYAFLTSRQRPGASAPRTWSAPSAAPCRCSACTARTRRRASARA